MQREDEERLYDELLGLCYECVFDHSAWIPLLERLIPAGGHQRGLLLAEYRKYDVQACTTLNLCDPAGVDTWNEFLCNLNPGLDPVHKRVVNRWYRDHMDHIPKSSRCSTSYQEFHVPFGLRTLSCVKLQEQSGSGIYMLVLNEVAAPPPTAQEQRLMERISPHLLKAAKLANKLSSHSLEVSKRDLLLNNHPTPLWLLDGDGRLLHCNQAAEKSISQGGSPLYQNVSRLHSKNQDTSLQALIRRAAGKNGERRPGWLRLAATPPHELLITPILAPAHDGRHSHESWVLLTLLMNRLREGLAAELFQLSPAEQRLAELLTQDLCLTECAERLNLSINTVRTQLRVLFRKTGTTRQPELINLFARLRQG